MKPKFNSRAEYRVFIKGVKSFLNDELDIWDCPFEGGFDYLKPDDVCVKTCGTVFKELICGKLHKTLKGCPCTTIPKNKRHTIKKRARNHLNTAIKQYKVLYR